MQQYTKGCFFYTQDYRLGPYMGVKELPKIRPHDIRTNYLLNVRVIQDILVLIQDHLKVFTYEIRSSTSTVSVNLTILFIHHFKDYGLHQQVKVSLTIILVYSGSFKVLSKFRQFSQGLSDLQFRIIQCWLTPYAVQSILFSIAAFQIRLEPIQGNHSVLPH